MYAIPKRICYLLLIIAVIGMGLLSRKITAIPAATGDALYAVMMFFIVRFIFINKLSFFIFMTSLSLCFLIECSQLYQATWINTIRATWPGHMILGQGFLWSDLVAYTLGAAMGLGLDRFINIKNQ